MKHNIDIAFAINDSYAQHCCVAITSVLHNNPQYNCRFYLLTDYISDKNKKLLCTIPNRFGTGHSVEIIVIDNELFKKCKIYRESLTIHTYYRLLLAKLLPNLDRVLYLDSDLVVDGSLSELWNMPMEGILCAGVNDSQIEEHGHKYTIGLTKDDIYVNAGVLLLNLKDMRLQNITEMMMNISDEMRDIFPFQDQDIINWTMRGKIAYLPWVYNFSSVDKLGEPSQKPIILHYTGDVKPWTIYIKCQHIFTKRYFKYLAMTPYSSFLWKFRLGRIDRRIKKIMGKDLYAIKG